MRDKKVKNPREDRPLSREMTQALRKIEWLSDDHIDGGLVLLRKLNEDVCGLFNIDNGLTAYPKADGDQWIQVLHNGRQTGGQWSLVAYGFLFFPKGTIALYDSLNYQPNSFVIAAAASLLRTKEQSINLSLLPSSQQKNGFDCGVFAIANAAALLYNLDPSKIEFDASVIRDHFKKCLKNGKMTSFPYSTSKLAKTLIPINHFVEKVFCYCRRPQKFKVGKTICKDEEMLQCVDCSELYHRICLPVTCSSNFKKKNSNWACPTCSTA